MLRTAIIILLLATPCRAYRVYICDPNLPKTKVEVQLRKKGPPVIIDLNRDGIINLLDLAILVKDWLESSK